MIVDLYQTPYELISKMFHCSQTTAYENDMLRFLKINAANRSWSRGVNQDSYLGEALFES